MRICPECGENSDNHTSSSLCISTVGNCFKKVIIFFRFLTFSLFIFSFQSQVYNLIKQMQYYYKNPISDVSYSPVSAKVNTLILLITFSTHSCQNKLRERHDLPPVTDVASDTTEPLMIQTHTAWHSDSVLMIYVLV